MDWKVQGLNTELELCVRTARGLLRRARVSAASALDLSNGHAAGGWCSIGE